MSTARIASFCAVLGAAGLVAERTSFAGGSNTNASNG
jgi:hypothetical protein